MEELCKAVDAMEVEYEGRMIRTTMSAGVTQGIPRNDSWTAIMNRADRALYGAKHAGRNCVVVDEQVLKLPRRVIGSRDEGGGAAGGERVGFAIDTAAARVVR